MHLSFLFEQVQLRDSVPQFSYSSHIWPLAMAPVYGSTTTVCTFLGVFVCFGAWCHCSGKVNRKSAIVWKNRKIRGVAAPCRQLGRDSVVQVLTRDNETYLQGSHGRGRSVAIECVPADGVSVLATNDIHHFWMGLCTVGFFPVLCSRHAVIDMSAVQGCMWVQYICMYILLANLWSIRRRS